jgi:hypothetical protein
LKISRPGCSADATFVEGTDSTKEPDIAVVFQARLVSLADLLRRIPELQLLIEEILVTVPLSFSPSKSAGRTRAGRDTSRRRRQSLTLAEGQPDAPRFAAIR